MQRMELCTSAAAPSLIISGYNPQTRSSEACAEHELSHDLKLYPNHKIPFVEGTQSGKSELRILYIASC